MRSIEIELPPAPAHSYPILIGSGLVSEAGARLEKLLPRKKLAIISDAALQETHLPKLCEGLDKLGIAHSHKLIAEGEPSKSWAELQSVCEWLISEEIERGDMVLAFGGGVVGDLTGFAASMIRRGVRFVQIPTTLLSQIDSSIGGKTAINSKAGKNLIGAFHEPHMVLIDMDVLETLPAREMKAGYAEMVKAACLADKDFFTELEKNGDKVLARDKQILPQMIERACQIKADIVKEDEKEAKDKRALLNLGHSFGHALEAANSYQNTLLHGEAVAIGTCLAFAFSAKKGHCPTEDSQRVSAHFAKLGLPHKLSQAPKIPQGKEWLELMRQDKKAQSGRIVLILAKAIGTCFVERKVNEQELQAFLEEQSP